MSEQTTSPATDIPPPKPTPADPSPTPSPHPVHNPEKESDDTTTQDPKKGPNLGTL
jgi:hypothetical protein